MLTQNKDSTPTTTAKRYLLYALGEIILVVIGILLALQINTWNQARINAKEERRIYQDLAEEMEFNTFLLQNGRKTMEQVIITADHFLTIINDPTTPFKEADLYEEVNKLTWVWVSGRSTSLYDVLSGSGDFNLIGSPVMRKKLADLKANQEILLRFEGIQNDFVDDQLRPFLNKNVDRTKVRSRIEASTLITTLHSSIFPSASGELLQNREFANLLIDLKFFTDRIIKAYYRIEKDITQIDSLIALKYPGLKVKPYVPY